MTGAHDCGGMDGFGRVPISPGEAVFQHEWEERVFALDGAITAFGACSIDEMRHAIERMDSAAYLRATYYERWLAGFELLLREKGVLSQEELSGGPTTPYRGAPLHRLTAAEIPDYVSRRRSHRSPEAIEPRFRVGQRVVARNVEPNGHTRLPRYARSHRGEIVHDHGVFTFPDAIGNARPDVPQHLYTVRFCACELWGEAAEANTDCLLDLYEQYIDPA